MRRHIAIATLLAAALLSLPNARADVVYTFSGSVPALIPAFSWSFTTSSLITSNTTVLAASLSSLSNPAGCTVSSVSITNPGANPFTANTNFTPGCGPFNLLSSSFNFPGPINFGTFNTGSVDIPGTLVVSTEIPEPFSLMLFGTGALGLLRPIRRKLLPRRQ